MGSAPALPPAGGAGLFADVSSELAADVVLGNLEGTLSTGSGSRWRQAQQQLRRLPRRLPSTPRLRDAGFTVLGLANDHSVRFRQQTGSTRRSTRSTPAGCCTTGRPGEVALQRVGAVTVAIAGFAPYEWSQSLTDLEAAQRLVREADARADVVIATMHAGAEGPRSERVPAQADFYLVEIRGNPRAFAQRCRRREPDTSSSATAASAARNGVVSRSADRLLARTFVAYKTTPLGGPLSIGAVVRLTLPCRGSSRPECSCRHGSAPTGYPRSTQRCGIGHDPALSLADFGPRGARVSTSGALLAAPGLARCPFPVSPFRLSGDTATRRKR